MKRRTFLTAASTVGVVGVASSATVVSSVYNNLSLNVLLEDLEPSTRIALDKFVSDIIENTESSDEGTKLAKKIAMPIQILSNDVSKNNQAIIYKNKFGHIISLTASNNAESKVVLLQA